MGPLEHNYTIEVLNKVAEIMAKPEFIDLMVDALQPPDVKWFSLDIPNDIPMLHNPMLHNPG